MNSLILSMVLLTNSNTINIEHLTVYLSDDVLATGIEQSLSDTHQRINSERLAHIERMHRGWLDELARQRSVNTAMM